MVMLQEQLHSLRGYCGIIEESAKVLAMRALHMVVKWYALNVLQQQNIASGTPLQLQQLSHQYQTRMRRWLRQTSAATLVATQCMEAAEAIGAECDHLASVVSSAVNLLAKGSELLKRTRNDDLHSKSEVVSIYIHRTGQVMLKIKRKLDIVF
ncbi:hypothetical protein P8452_62071 [Trifolium repens]|nr:hypothetical protein P8452_62071 [Trifolium repens]